MGDADVPVNMLRNPEVDDQLEDIEEQINGIFYYIDLLQSRTSQIVSQKTCCQKFHQWFAVLNILVFPVILAIIIAYATDGMVTPESMIKTAFETSIYILMFVSSFIGLPLYVFTIWDIYVIEDHVNNCSTSNDSVQDHEDESLLEIIAERETANNSGPFRQTSRSFLPPQHRTEREDRSIEEVEEQEKTDSVESLRYSISINDLPVTFKDSKRLIYEISDSDTSSSENSQITHEGFLTRDNLTKNQLMDGEKKYDFTINTSCSNSCPKSDEGPLMMDISLENQLVDGEKNDDATCIPALESMMVIEKSQTGALREIPIRLISGDSKEQVTI